MATLKEDLQTALNSFIENYTSENAVLALTKTFQSHNITIEDWNQMLIYLNRNTQFNEHVKEILPEMVEAIENCVVTTSNIQSINPEDYKSGTIILDTSSKIMYIVQNNTASVFLNLTTIENTVTQEELQEAISSAVTNIQETYINPMNTHLESLDETVGDLDDRIETLEDLAEEDSHSNKHILKIGDSVTNEIEATFAIFTETLHNLGYPKYAYAICIEPTNSETPEENILPFRGDTLFIYAKRGDIAGYEVHSSGKTYWFTANSVTEIFATKEDLTTKQDALTFDSIPTANSSNPVTSGGVYTSVEAVRLVAEGKCKSYTISIVDNPAFNSQDSSLDNIQNITDITQNIIPISSLKNGDIILIVEVNVPDRWFSIADSKFYILETAKVDLSQYYTRTETDQKFATNTGLESKLDKVTRMTETNQVYVKTTGGAQVMFDIAVNPSASTIPFRTDNGMIRTATPTDNNDATNKLYVDGKFIEAISVSKNLISDEYRNTELYAVGDLVIYNNTLYRCTTAVTTAENFDSTKWTATTVDAELLNKVDLDSNQTMSGILTLLNSLFFGSSSTSVEKEANSTRLLIKILGDPKLKIGYTEIVSKANFSADSNNNYDLGRLALAWRDLYLSGKIKDGTNEFDFNNVFNRINGSDIDISNVTDAQISLFTNGKPTLINGDLLNVKNIVLLNCSPLITDRYYYFLAVYTRANNQKTYFGNIYIDTQNKTISFSMPDLMSFSNGGLEIKRKNIPNFPTSNTEKQVPVIAPNGGALSWEDKPTTLYSHEISFGDTDQTKLKIINSSPTQITDIDTLKQAVINGISIQYSDQPNIYGDWVKCLQFDRTGSTTAFAVIGFNPINNEFVLSTYVSSNISAISSDTVTKL